MSELADLRAIQPVPFFPVLKARPAWLKRAPHNAFGLRMEAEPMFYVPALLKSLDGMWLARCVKRKLDTLAAQGWRPDVVDAHFGYPDGVGCVRVAQRLGLPVFVTIRGSETDFLGERAIAPQLVRALNAATGCISVSHSLRRTVIESGVDGERVRVIHNAVDRSIFRPEKKELARQSVGIDPGTRLVVSVGHLVAGKRHNVLIRAMARLSRRFPNIQLVIIGGPSYDRTHPAELEQLVRELGIGRYVKFLGVVNQASTSQWLRAADVFALATAREGCCNAVLEALSTGTPVVTTPVGDNAHFVRDQLNGTIVPVDDIEGLVAGVSRALERDWDSAAVSASLKIGGWSDVARLVLEFFEERLARQSSNNFERGPALAR